MSLARDIVRGRFARALVEYRGILWHWEGSRWVERDDVWLLDRCREHFESAYVAIEHPAPDEEPIERLCPPGWMVREVASCIETVCRQDAYRQTPFSLNGSVNAEPRVTVSFSGGQLVSVAEGQVSVLDQVGRSWFDLVNVPCQYDGGADCVRWEETLSQWSGGDTSWVELVQLIFGYCLLPHRDYQRWFLFYGLPRSGKGTILRVLSALLGGGGGVWHTTMPELAGNFGMDGLQTARVMVINEVHEVGALDGHRVGGVLKSVVGGDPLQVNVKRIRQLRNVHCQAVPILQSNEIPTLPNRGAGLSSKMIVVPFGVSFLDREDEGLSRALIDELPGIAAWAVEGARKLSATTPDNRWPEPRAAKHAMDEYREENNPWDEFLEKYFVADRAGWVAQKRIWEAYCVWKAVAVQVPHAGVKSLGRLLLRDSSWTLSRWRMGEDGARGIRGLRLKR